MCKEMKVIKMGGVTHAGNVQLQQLGVSDNAMSPGFSGYQPDEAQKKTWLRD